MSMDLAAIAIGEALTLLFALLASIRARKARDEAHSAVTTLHRLEISVNGRLTQVINQAKEIGRREGMEEAHAEHDDPPGHQPQNHPSRS